MYICIYIHICICVYFTRTHDVYINTLAPTMIATCCDHPNTYTSTSAYLS